MSTNNTNNHGLITHLHETLIRLENNPCPYVAGPENVKKRASVALIIRIQPSYSHWPEDTDSQPTHDLESFFSQDWVKHGQPEVLFIKRAARKGDRWTSHVALPGGRRDPEDADDQQAAIREAIEEVGIDLSTDSTIPVGNLPQRIVTTSWGKVPLMVLCPYVFLLTNHNTPPLRLQPTEVASTHWVPISALLSKSQRTASFEDVSNRLANQETGVKRWMLRAMLGKMEFAAIHLLPTESLYCHESPAEHNTTSTEPSHLKSLFGLGNSTGVATQNQPLILWGLTLGVLADFLDLLPPHNALDLWTYPTFTSPDVRLVIWLTTYRFRAAKRKQLEHCNNNDNAAEVGLGGLGSGGGVVRSVESSMMTLLEGYYALLRKGVAVALVSRAVGFSALVAWLVLRYRERRSIG